MAVHALSRQSCLVLTNLFVHDLNEWHRVRLVAHRERRLGQPLGLHLPHSFPYFLDKNTRHNGKIPVKISAQPEGSEDLVHPPRD
eukprot:COSAG01_NODE_15451_length_1336_cov_2.333872_1_plen_85_part_00